MTSLSYDGPVAGERRSAQVRRPRRVAIPTALALLASALVVPLAGPAATARAAAPADYTQFVNPFIGTSGDHGQDGPGAIAPYGLATVTPTTTSGNHVGYEYTSNTLLGFTNVALDGVGGGGGAGDVLVVPTYQTYTARPSTSSYNKTIRTDANGKVESGTAGYYQVGLAESGNAIDAQVTAATRTGVHDYAFGTAGHAALVVDLQHTGNGRKATDLRVGTSAAGNATLSGSFTGYFYNSSYRLYYYAETTVPTTSVQTWGSAGLGSATSQNGTDIGAVLNFAATAGQHVGLRVTLSPVSVEQAKRDAAVEVGGRTFDEVRDATKAEWNARLGKVDVDATATNDPTGDLKVQFYTHLYRLADTPMNATSTDGTYRGVDGRIYAAKGYTHYDSWSLWDDFHKYAAVASVFPDVYRDVVQSLVDLYAEVAVSGKASVGGLLQSVPTVRWERSPVVIADAVSKGVRLRGLEQAYPALVAQVGGAASLTNLDSRAGGLLGYSYDAYGLSVIADAIDKTSAAATYRDQAARWAKAFDKDALVANTNAMAATGVAAGVDKVGLVMPRSSNSDTASFTATDPEAWQVAGLYQGTLWQYNWYDAQDLGGMIAMMGGRGNAAKSVNYFFGNHVPDDCSRNLHLFANEISVHAPFLFNYVGQPSQTQDWTYRTLTEPVCTRYTADGSSSTPSKKQVFQNSAQGLLETMDNDAGTMSGYFVSTAIGLYPVMAGGATFQITTPIFDRTTVHYEGGKDFVIEAPGVGGANHYIQSATFNGKQLNRTWLTAAEMNAGGVLHFTMGSTPSTWGADGPAEDSLNDHVSSSLYDSSSALSTDVQVFAEDDANDGSIGNTISVTASGATFAGDAGSDLTSQVTATGLPAGLTLKATRTASGALDLSPVGRATSHLVDDSTDALVVTLAAGAFEGTAPGAAERSLALKVRFAGYGITPSTTAITADAAGVVNSTVDLTLTGGAVFTGSTGSVLPAEAATFPGLDSGVTAVVTRTGDTSARVAFSGTLTGTSTTHFTLRLADTALTGATAAAVTGPGTTAIDPFSLSPASTTRAELLSLYDDARLETAGSYSATSFAALTSALASAKAVLHDTDSSEYVLAQTLAVLRAALDGLVIADEATRTTVEFESLQDSDGLFSGNAALVLGVDYANGTNGFDASKDNLKTEANNGGRTLSGVTTGAWVRYQDVELGDHTADKLTVTYDAPTQKSVSPSISLYVDSMAGAPLVTASLANTGSGWGTYATSTIDLPTTLTGTHTLYLKFASVPTSALPYVGNFDSFSLLYQTEQVDTSTELKVAFKSIMAANGYLDADSTLAAGTDFANGNNGFTTANQNRLKTETNTTIADRVLAGTTNGAWVRYHVDLGTHTAGKLSLYYDAPSGKSISPRVTVYADSMSSTPLVSARLASTGSTWNSYTTATLSLDSPITGRHDLYFVLANDAAPTSGAPYVGNFSTFSLLYDKTVVDKSALVSAIDTYTHLTSEGDRYLAADFAVFSRAFAAAQDVVADTDATAAQVKAALRQLTLSAGQLQWKVIRQVADWIARAEAVHEEEVTPSSYAVLTAAVTSAKALDPATSSHDDYSSALSGLTSAYGNLDVAYTPALSAPPVDPGTAAQVTGSGFAAGEVVTFSWTTSQPPTGSWTATADADGDVTTTVTLPRATADGTYPLKAVGETSAVPVTTDVTVAKVMRVSRLDFLAIASSITEGQDLAVQLGVTSGATGTVELLEGATSLGHATLDGGSKATITASRLAVGTHTLTASYSGDEWYATSSTAAVTVTVDAVKVPPVETSVTASAPVLSKGWQAYGSTTGKRATISTTVTGTTSGKVTFRSGTKVLGTASVAKSGNASVATLLLPSTLEVGSYRGLTATLVTGSATVTSVASAATFTVVKATTSKVAVSGKKFRRGTHPKVTVKVSTLSNGHRPTGRVKVYVGKKLVKTVRLTSGKHGKVTVTLPKRYYRAISVKAKFVPSSSSTVASKTSKTVTIKTKR